MRLLNADWKMSFGKNFRFGMKGWKMLLCENSRNFTSFQTGGWLLSLS